jgi:outer membrane biosynthesis protein TonB
MGTRGLLPEVVVATAGHVVAIVAVVLARCQSDAAPLFDPDDVMIVSMTGPLQETSRMPQKAERAPEVSRGAAAAATPTPPTDSDMVENTPDAAGDPSADARAQVLRDMERRSLLDDLDVPEGKVDRRATGANAGDGSANVSDGIVDAELARWQKEARRRVAEHWHPLLSICRSQPELTTFVRVSVAGNGTTEGEVEVGVGSGNPSVDAAALRAVQAVPGLPPLPAKYADGVNATLKFVCKEAL